MTQVLQLPPLSAFQRPIFYDDRHWLIIAGRRSGKSGVALLRGVKTAMRGGRVSWASANKDTAEAGWEETVEFCKPYATRVASSEDGIMEFFDAKTGATGSIERRSAYSKSSGRGYTYNLIIIDEVQMTDQSFFKRILPSILTTGGHTCLLGTPPETPQQIEACDWIKGMLDHPDRYATDWLIVHRPTSYKDVAFYMRASDRGIKKSIREYERMAKESLSFLRKTMGREDYEREIEAAWPQLKIGRLVYEIFDLDQHCLSEYDYRPGGGPVFWVFDRGEGQALTIALLVQWQAGRLVIFNECAERDLISEETMVNRVLQMDYDLPQTAVYDSRAPGYLLALTNAGLSAEPGAGRDVQRGIGIVKRWIEKGRIVVNPRCLVTLENFERYKTDHRGLPQDTHNDALDALRYLVRYLSEQEGEVWSEEDESRAIVESKGGGLDYGAVLEIKF